MDLNIKTTKDIEEIADFVATSINKKLAEGERVLLFVSGGSATPMEVLVSQKIKEEFSDKLVVTLTDERYGDIGHRDSNWFALEDAGFKIPKATMIPFLSGDGMRETTIKLREILKDELSRASYKIGIFGIGIDSHTAGILPNTEAIESRELICTYETEMYDRITITPKTIFTLDEAILYAMGETKWRVVEKLEKDSPIEEEPAQILKKVPLLTIFTDKK